MKKKLEKEQVRIWTAIAISAFTFFFIFLPAVMTYYENPSDDSPNTVANGFTIEKYNVVLDVKEDNQINVTENITVNWDSNYHHGIIRFIPEWLEYTSKKGNIYKRKSVVYNLNSPGEPFVVDYMKSKARIRIGDANSYVNVGNKDYTIKYIYDMGKDPYRGFDEFIFHAFGDYWGTSINNPSLEIRMPKNVDASKIKFFTDKYRKNDITNMVDYYVDNNVIYASLDTNKYMKLYKSLTVDLELPEGYFVGGSFNYGRGSFITIMIIIVLTIFTALRWLKYGKDFPRVAKTVEFYPPGNMNAAEIGYIYNKNQGPKLTIALIVQLASKGYIRIDEVGDKEKEIQITNLVHKPKEVIAFDSVISPKTINIKKLKDVDSTLSSKEKKFMNSLFKKSDFKILTENEYNFEEVKNSLISKGYIEILDNIESENYLKNIRKEYEKLKEEYDKKIKENPLDETENLVYKKLFDKKDVVKLKEHKTFYYVFSDVNSKVYNKLNDLVVDQKSFNKLLLSVLVIYANMVLCFVSFVFEDLSPQVGFLYKVSLICIPINLFFTIFMGRKTQYGEKIKSQVAGFRKFLVKVEKDKLETLVMENPSYFYDILPYTYVLNISKKWIKKFENIPVPEMDMGNFDYGSDSSYSDLTSDIYKAAPSSSSGSSRGCSSCGGGCSSCGGGCSSCGGGGSW